MPPFILIILLAGFPALATDMYLPALPMLQEMWQLSLAQANFSLVIFFITSSLCLLPASICFCSSSICFLRLSAYLSTEVFSALRFNAFSIFALNVSLSQLSPILSEM